MERRRAGTANPRRRFCLPRSASRASIFTHTPAGQRHVLERVVANTQMHGQGTFFDPRLNDPARFPIAVKAGDSSVRHVPDEVTSKLAALHFYQLAIPAPTPPARSFDATAAGRGKIVFESQAKCATVPRAAALHRAGAGALHKGAEIGIDEFQAERSPDKQDPTTPLRGLFTRMKGWFITMGASRRSTPSSSTTTNTST